MTPKVSIIMPVYNGEKFLEKAIKSILDQSLTDYEFLIIDDSSTDKSRDVIQKFALEDKRIILLNNKYKKGIIGGLNTGLDFARGKYIARMDCDDISLPNRLEVQVNFLENNPQIGLCASNINEIDEKGNIVREKLFKETNVPLAWLLIWQNPIAHPTVILRTETLKKNNIKYADNKLTEDYSLWTRLAPITGFVRLNDVLLLYRVTSNSTFHSKKNLYLEDSILTSINYAKTITNVQPPSFHSDLTFFQKMIEDKQLNVSMAKILNWFNKLLSKSAILWKFSDKERAIIRLEIKKECLNIYKNQKATTKIKSILSLFINLEFKLFLEYLFIFFRTIVKKILKNLRFPMAMNIFKYRVAIFLSSFKSNLKHSIVKKKNLKKIGIATFPHDDTTKRFGDLILIESIKKIWEESGYTVNYIPYNPNYKKTNYFLKKLFGIPYIYSKIINEKCHEFDLIFVDSNISYSINCPNVISIFQYSYNGYLKLAGQFWDKKAKLRHTLFSKLQIRGSKSTYNVAVSDFLKNILEKDGVKVDSVIYNATDTKMFFPKTPFNQKTNYVYAGGYSYGKGFDILEALAQKGVKIDCYTNFSKEDGINYLPYVEYDQMPKIYNKYKICFYPSRFESCQMTPLDAMACGTPVIITNVGLGSLLKEYIPEFVVEGENLVDQYLERIALIEANYEYYCKRAREYAENVQSYSNFKQGWLGILEKFKI